MFFKFSRLAASVRRSRSRPARRFVAPLSLALGSPLRCGALARARLAALCFRRRSRSRSARRSVRRFVAALSLAPGSPPSVSGGGFRRRQRLFARPSAALSLTLGSPPCAALPLALGSPPSVSGGGFRRRQRLFVRPSAPLSLTLGSPLCGGALAPGSPPSVSGGGLRRWFTAVVYGGGKGSLCDLRAALSRPARRPFCFLSTGSRLKYP